MKIYPQNLEPLKLSIRLFAALAMLSLLTSCASNTAKGPETIQSSYQGPPAIELSSVQKRRLAERVAQYFDTNLVLAPSEGLYLDRVNKTKDLIEKKSKESYRYAVYVSSRIHAFALASGDIRFHSGLLDVVDTDDELLALIACLHAEIRNGFADEAIEQAYNAAVVSDPSIKEALRKAPFPDYAIARVAQLSTMYQFSLEQLQTCDRESVKTLKRIKADPKAVNRLLTRLSNFELRAENQDRAFYDINITHPLASERLEKLTGKQPKNNRLGSSTASSSTEEYDGVVKTATLKAQSNESGTSFDDEPLTNLDAQGSEPGPTPKQEVQAPSQVKEVSEPKVEQKANDTAIRWYVQMSADESEDKAIARKISLDSLGYATQLQDAVVNGVQYWRVLVGPFPNQDQALAKRPELAQTGFADGSPFVRKLP